MTETASSSPVSHSPADLFRDLSTELLRQGKIIRFRAPGRSMYPTIKENEVITVEPIEPSSISIGDIILYRQERSVVAHRVVRIIKTELAPSGSPGGEHPSNHTRDLSLVARRSFLLRGDTWGKEDPKPVTDAQILGKVIRVERNGRHVNPYSKRARLRLLVHTVGSRFKRLF
jgi:signal peptidase I